MAAHLFSPRSQARIEQGDDGTRKGSIINHAGGAMCAGCNTSVDDGKTAIAVRALGKQWHKECFTCMHCKHAIGSQFSSHEGKAYCDPCFEKHVAKAACPGCRKLVVGHFVKALGREWHRECFVCATCKKDFPDNVYENCRHGNKTTADTPNRLRTSWLARQVGKRGKCANSVYSRDDSCAP